MTTRTKPRQPTRACDPRQYARLLAQTLPAAIHSAAECERASTEIDKLLRKGVRNLSPEEERLLELFSLLVEQYEDETIVFPSSPPSRTLQFLMEQNELTPADLANIFGSGEHVIEFMEGKRAISRAQAEALGKLFRVSSELFGGLTTGEVVS